MSKRHRPWIKRLICPGCAQRGTLRTIVYGMPEENFDYEKFSSGGCLVAPGQPDIDCRECRWAGNRNDLDNFYPDRIFD